jgi:hypothetical protein
MAHADDQPRTVVLMYESRTVDELKRLGAHLIKVTKEMAATSRGAGISAAPTGLPARKAEIVGWIERLAQNDAFLRGYYDRMRSLEKTALQEVVHSPDGVLDTFRFEAKYGDVPSFNSSGFWSRDRKGEEGFPALSFLITDGGWLPPDLRSRLGRFVPKPAALEAKPLEGLPENVKVYGGRESAPLVVHGTEQAALHDVMAVLRLVDTGKVGVGAKTGRISQSSAAALRGMLSHGDFYPEEMEADADYDVQMGPLGIRPFAWAMLLQAANLAHAAGSKLELTRSGKAALKKEPQETIATLWQKWLKSKMLHEMNRIEVIKGQKSAKRPLSAAEPCREVIAGALSELEEGDWVRTVDFFKFLIGAGHGFDVVRNGWALYITDPQYGSFGYDHIEWEHASGRFTRAFLLEYAATLGLIDVALVPPWGALSDRGGLWGADDLSCLSRYDGLWALRLNSLGAWVLGKKETYVASFQEEPSLRFLSNLEVSAAASSVSPSDALFLDRVCERISERVWRLSLPKALRAMEEGVEAQRFMAFIEERTQGDLPQTVREFFDDLASRVRKLRDLGEARIVQCADSSLAQLIVRDRRLKDLCFPAGDRVLVVPKAYEALFREALRELGYVVGAGK